MLVMLVNALAAVVIRPPAVVSAIIRITAVVAVVTARVIPISRISVVRNDMRDNRSLLRLLLSRLKPERQLVLLEPEPVRSLPMEVKKFFIRSSYL